MLSSLPQTVYFHLVSVPECGKSELKWEKMERDGQGFAAPGKMSPWPRVPRRGGRWRLRCTAEAARQGSVPSPSLLFDVTCVASALCSLACAASAHAVTGNVSSRRRDADSHCPLQAGGV